MITAFHIYTLNAAVCLYGVLLFLWWWVKTKRATEVYKYVTLLLAAEFFEKSVLAILRYVSFHSSLIMSNPSIHNSIVTSRYWPFLSIPALFAYGLIVVAMTKRVVQSTRALNRSPELTLPHKKTKNSVLVISTVKRTRNFMNGVFVSNRVEYRQAHNFMQGLDMLVNEYRIAVVMVGLSALEEAGIRQDDAVRLIKKERPWAIVVALTRNPNMYELMEARRSFFDDYIYLPVGAERLMASFDRWIARINRWKNLEGKDRRKKSGDIGDRKRLVLRKHHDVELKEKGEKQ